MFFLRFIPTREVWYVYPVYIFVFIFASLALERIFYQIGLVHYTGWNPFDRFIASTFVFFGAAWHQGVLDKLPTKGNQEAT